MRDYYFNPTCEYYSGVIVTGAFCFCVIVQQMGLARYARPKQYNEHVGRRPPTFSQTTLNMFVYITFIHFVWSLSKSKYFKDIGLLCLLTVSFLKNMNGPGGYEWLQGVGSSGGAFHWWGRRGDVSIGCLVLDTLSHGFYWMWLIERSSEHTTPV